MITSKNGFQGVNEYSLNSLLALKGHLVGDTKKR